MITKPEDKRIVRDGERVRVPLMLMDELQRSVQGSRFHDGMGHEAGHKPGFVFVTAHDQTEACAAHETYVKLLGDAWKGAETVEATTTKDAYADYVARLSDAWRSP